MSSHTEAVESIRVLAARLEGITKVANALERIGSLEDAERDARDRLAATKQAEADRLLNAARDQAAQMVTLARTNAAVADVDAIEKAKLAAASQALVDAATKELDELNQRLTSARSQAARILAGD